MQADTAGRRRHCSGKHLDQCGANGAETERSTAGIWWRLPRLHAGKPCRAGGDPGKAQPHASCAAAASTRLAAQHGMQRQQTLEISSCCAQAPRACMVLSTLEGSSATCPGGKGGINGGGDGDGAKPPPRMAPALRPPPPELLPPGVGLVTGVTAVGEGLVPEPDTVGAGGPEGGLATTVTADAAPPLPPSAAACCSKSATPAAVRGWIMGEKSVRIQGQQLWGLSRSARWGSWQQRQLGPQRRRQQHVNRGAGPSGDPKGYMAYV